MIVQACPYIIAAIIWTIYWIISFLSFYLIFQRYDNFFLPFMTSFGDLHLYIPCRNTVQKDGHCKEKVWPDFRVFSRLIGRADTTEKLI
jgi:hypothetical protein